ncbi:hypothetical protein [Actinotalea fermentans]|uniref:Uncharacterized protein n=1 Tax=Actinotalea fermentans TaxID=43671 RepID=A0A511Z0K6_9CELL|nr:hypothetical protein [Actinotalea fermentans]GEN80975.1 hypothetical protein AFE02nite_27090 [Actinotalea fermentans]
MSSTGGGEGRWPFDRVSDGTGGTPQWSAQPPQPAQSPQPAQPPQPQWSAQPPQPGQPPVRQSVSAHASQPPSRPVVPEPAGWGTGAPAQQPAARSGFGVHAGTTSAGAGSAQPPASRRDAAATPPRRRRPPLWLLIVIGVVVVGGIVAAVLLLTGQDEPEAPPAATVTLPVPTPTIDPIQREPGTPFFDALPSTVLQYVLTETGESEDLLLGGALEGYRLVYSDGGATTLTVLAGQWADATGPQARLDGVLAQVTGEVGEVPEAGAAGTADDAEEPAEDEDGATATPTEEPLPSPEQGPVQVDGQDVGRYVFLPRADGTGTLWWTNTTVFVQLDGPWSALRDVFTAFSL